ncbi:uncharacterized protein LOC123541971 [Mercenaria mercenaria]|uniref:uncharacterized protein LOC123541971 n=1 Tax=Mercenaria mercenaria TaxID=6596 RepID=UPI00234E4491|nr:uncharacterized protein LOC123541971 [Mercenaria mercenaria]
MNRIFGKKPKGLQEQDIEKNADVLATTCAKHPDQSLNLFCLECDNVYCTVCMMTGVHKKIYENHEIKCITGVADEFTDTTEFASYDEKMTKFRNDFDRTLNDINENMKESDKLKREVEIRIKQQKEALIKFIETQYQNMSETNNNKYAECLSRLKTTATKIAKLKKETEQIENYINKKRDKSDMTAVFIAVKKSKRKVAQIEDRLRVLNESNYVTRYDFQEGQCTQNFMKNTEDFGVFVENQERKTSTKLQRPLSRYKSLPSLQKESEYESHYDVPIEIEYVELQTTDTARGEAIQGDRSECKDSFNSSSAFNGAKPKPKPRLKTTGRNTSDDKAGIPMQSIFPMQLTQQISAINVKRKSAPPVPDPKPSAQAETKQANEKYASSFDKPIHQEQGPPLTCPKPSVQAKKQTKENYVSRYEAPVKKGKILRISGPPVTCLKPSAQARKQEKEQCASSFDAAVKEEQGMPVTMLTRPKPSVQARKRAKENYANSFDVPVKEERDKYKVLYPYTSAGEHDITIKEGDTVTVFEIFEDGWCWIEMNEKSGYVPVDYLEKMMK